MNRPQTAASMNQTKQASHTENRAPSITKWFCRKNKERKRKKMASDKRVGAKRHISHPTWRSLYTGEDPWTVWLEMGTEAKARKRVRFRNVILATTAKLMGMRSCARGEDARRWTSARSSGQGIRKEGQRPFSSEAGPEVLSAQEGNYLWTKEGECQNRWSTENGRGMCWTCCKALSQCIIHSTKKLRLGIGRVAVQRKERKIINGFWWMWGFQKPGRKCNKTWSGVEGKLEEELNIVNFRTERLSPHVWYTVPNEQCWEM